MNNKLLISAFMLFALSLSACSKGGGEKEKEYNIVRPEFDGDFTTYAVSEKPSGVNMTYYSDIYSRGFSWVTDTSVTDTKLYLVKGDNWKDADYSKATPVDGTSLEVTYDKEGYFRTKDNSIEAYKGKSTNDYELTVMTHKVHVENLEKDTAYSYKIGSEQGWYYGAFVTEKDNPQSVTAIQMSDAQTKDPSKLNVWRNTFTHAVDTAGKELDTVLYNGDQFDQNITKVNSSDQYKPNRFLCYTKALDVINDYKINIPYMASSGNHERTAPYSQYLMGDVNYSGIAATGCYYSYYYNFAHFIVLDSYDVTDAEINWLKNDLDSASNMKWKIVMLHISPYSTGDNSNSSDNQHIVEKLTPIFSSKHVDLVLQAHDHTYNKTLPYKWDAAGYTTEWNNQDVVNFEPETTENNGIVYDKNPQGTYYVTTGAAGHRCGASESDGVWSEVVRDGDGWKGLNSSKTFLSNKYKIQCGSLKYDNQYVSYQTGSYTSAQDYKKGDLASGNVNAQMFGVLKINKDALSYNAYTVEMKDASNSDVKLFDSVDIWKD